MPQAQIEINSVIGSDADLPINTLVQLDNNNIGGETTFLWSILDQPAGTTDSLSNSAIQNPTFTPKKEGTYLIQLTVNQGLPDEDTDTVIAAVRQLKSRERIPAAGEQSEASTSRGWAVDANRFLRFLDDSLADPGTVVGANATASPMAKGTVVRVTSGQTIKSGLPGQEIVPGFTLALATVGTNVDELLAVVEAGVDGSDPVAAGALARARYIGRVGTVALGSGAVGDPIFVNDSGFVDVNPGTVRRQVGSIMSVSGVNRDLWIEGTQGAEGTLTDRAYVLYGPIGTLPNAKRIDGLNATGATNNVPWTFKAGDDLTPSLVAKRNSASGQDLQQWQDEGGTILSRLKKNGALDVISSDATPAAKATASGTGSAVEADATGGSGYGVEAKADVTSPVKASLHVGPQDSDASSPAKGDVQVSTVTGKISGHNGSTFDRYVPQSYASSSDSDDVQNTAVETDFAQKYTIPANTLRASSTIRVYTHGRLPNGVSGNVIFKLYIGGTKVVQLSGAVSATDAFTMNAYATVRSVGVGGVYTVSGFGSYGNPTTGSPMNAYLLGGDGITIDTTAAADVKASVEFSVASPSNWARLNQIIVDVT